jgi:hypothetical protein
MRLTHALAVAILAAIGSANCQSARAQSCASDTLQTVGSSGEILVMSSGAVFQVLGGDEIDSALWLAPSDVLICARSFTNQQGRALTYYEIVNTDEGEKVGATRLH